MLSPAGTASSKEEEEDIIEDWWLGFDDLNRIMDFDELKLREL